MFDDKVFENSPEDTAVALKKIIDQFEEKDKSLQRTYGESRFDLHPDEYFVAYSLLQAFA